MNIDNSLSTNSDFAQTELEKKFLRCHFGLILCNFILVLYISFTLVRDTLKIKCKENILECEVRKSGLLVLSLRVSIT